MSCWIKIQLLLQNKVTLLSKITEAQSYGSSNKQSLTLNPEIQEPARAHACACTHTHTHTHTHAQADIHILTLALS